MPGAVGAGVAVAAAGAFIKGAGACACGCTIGLPVALLPFVAAGAELSGAPTAISQRWPGWPWGGFMPGAVAVGVACTGLPGADAGAAGTVGDGAAAALSCMASFVAGAVSVFSSLQESTESESRDANKSFFERDIIAIIF